MTDWGPVPEDDDMLIAEYATGVLPYVERVLLEARLKLDPALRARLVFWEARLVALEGDIAPVTPPVRVRAALEKQLFGEAEKPGFWASLGLWRGLSLAGFAAAAVLAGLMLRLPEAPPLDTDGYVADLQAEQTELRLVAFYEPSTGALRLNRAAGAPVAGRDFELWLIEGENAPVSLGVLPKSTTARLTVPETLRDKISGAVLAVSDEPTGGSPTGQPTGAVLAVGEMTLI